MRAASEVEVKEGSGRSDVMDGHVIGGRVGGYSSEQEGVNDPLTALFKMTKSILPY